MEKLSLMHQSRAIEVFTPYLFNPFIYFLETYNELPPSATFGRLIQSIH
jgi:hypothetical protein